MAKAPRPGLVKTRLCPPFEPEQAAAFFAEMLGDSLEQTAIAAERLGLSAWLVGTPDDALPELAELAGEATRGLFTASRFEVRPQRGAGLSARMESVVAEAAEAGFAFAILRGSDSPALSAERIEEGLRALRAGADLALCPDPDGGYSLVGLRTSACAGRGLFDHPMSTSDVLESTRARAEQLALRTETIAPSFDIDTAEDLRRLSAHRSAHPEACARSVGFLDRAGLWPR